MYATGLTLFYYDQRIRKEGFDIERMMEAAGMTAPHPAAAAQPTLAAESIQPDSIEPWPELPPESQQPSGEPTSTEGSPREDANG